MFQNLLIAAMPAIEGSTATPTAALNTTTMLAAGAQEDEMKQVILQTRVILTLLLVVFIGGCAANSAAPPGIEPIEVSKPPQKNFSAARSSDAAKPEIGGTEGTSGLVAHIDPTTGEFLPEAPANSITPQRAEAAKAPAPHFNVVPSPTLGGGVMVDLQGHFQAPLVATMDADGKVTMKHEPTAPAGTENK
jgi:hypothetical protein